MNKIDALGTHGKMLHRFGVNNVYEYFIEGSTVCRAFSAVLREALRQANQN
jgi:PII-like signaling protein